MTSPAPQAQDAAQYAEPTAAEAVVVAAIVAWLLGPSAVGAVTLPAELAARLIALGLTPKAVAAAGRIALNGVVAGVTRRRAGPSITTSAAYRAASDEPEMRARYILNAAKRLTVALEDGVPSVSALRNERRHFESSLAAGRRRLRAAAALDAAARISPWLEWRAVLDSRTTPDCAAMHGRIFTLDNPPSIGLPGTVHPRCRCTARPYGVAEFGAQPTVRRTTTVTTKIGV